MRISTLVLGLTLSASLLLAQQTLSVTPQTLAGWTLVGAEAANLAGQSSLTLPAGAQLARRFSNDDFSLQLKTRPVVGSSEADWPVLELGKVALVFGRNGPTGRLTLVLGSNAPQPLPFEFALDAEDRSKASLLVTLARDGSAVSVQFSGRTLQFPVNRDASGPLEFVASAGASHAWTIENLTVTGIVAEPIAPAVAGSDSLDGASVIDELPRSRAITEELARADTRAAATASQLDVAAAKGSPPANANAASKSTLEVFTPPAFRRGRADALRVPNLPRGNK